MRKNLVGCCSSFKAVIDQSGCSSRWREPNPVQGVRSCHAATSDNLAGAGSFYLATSKTGLTSPAIVRNARRRIAQPRKAREGLPVSVAEDGAKPRTTAAGG